MSKAKTMSKMRRVRRVKGAPDCHAQSGSVLIEALLAALIFALVSIGAMGLILSTTRSAADTRLRMEAASLAEDILGRMQADMGTSLANLGNYDDASGTAPAPKAQWRNNVAASLPAGVGNITVDSTYAGGLASDVSVQIRWTAGTGVNTTNGVYSISAILAPNQ